MKKLAVICITTALLFTSTPNTLKAEVQNRPAITTVLKNDDKARANALLNRLHEIHRMDKSGLSKEEKTKLGNEVLAIRQGLQDISGGLYLSFGAIIIILLLILILF